jgi:RNA polymerase sigma-70 factor (ECF subfamily)
MGTWPEHVAFERVLESARAGDDAAFAVLWRWLHPGLLRWLRVVTPGAVEDVASEVWISVVRGLTTFRGDDRDFRGWVYTIARRRSIDWARHRQRQPSVNPMDGVDPCDPATNEAVWVDATSAREAALALLRRLRPDQREVVALRVVVGMTVAETARIVNKSEGAVRVLCHRGLRTLAQHVDAEQLAEV